MRLRTLADLRASAVSLANAPTPTATTSASLTDWNGWINAGRAELFRKVVSAAGPTAYLRTTIITTQNVPNQGVLGTSVNTFAYDLPRDFWELTRVQLQLNITDFVTLERFTEAERPYLMSATPGWNGEPFKYCLMGKPSEVSPQQIEFLPIPAANLNVYVGYIYGPPLLVTDVDQLDGFAGFEEYVIVFAARRAAMKTEQRERAAELLGEMARLELDVLAQSKQTDAYSPPRVMMTREPWRPRYARRR